MIRFAIAGFLCLVIHFSQRVFAAPSLTIVGSSAVFPFAATVAEHFHLKTQLSTPLIEAIGTGAGIKLFCSHLQGPDGVMTSRPFTEGERKKCVTNGVTFEEFKIGRDGLVLLQNKSEQSFSLTLSDLQKVLAEKLSKQNICISNFHKTWDSINADFPSHPIRVWGPAPTSGTYDVLIEKIAGACGPYLRHDGAYVQAPANENLIVQKVLNASNTMGIVTFSFYDQNKGRLNALPVEGVLPSDRSIQDGSYPLSRYLYLYIKTNDIVNHPIRSAYILEFTSKDASGERGYLKEKGLIPLSSKEHEETQRLAQQLRKTK